VPQEIDNFFSSYFRMYSVIQPSSLVNIAFLLFTRSSGWTHVLYLRDKYERIQAWNAWFHAWYRSLKPVLLVVEVGVQ